MIDGQYNILDFFHGHRTDGREEKKKKKKRKMHDKKRQATRSDKEGEGGRVEIEGVGSRLGIPFIDFAYTEIGNGTSNM